MSVAAHMISPPSRNLFQRAIIQSDPFTIATKTRALSLEAGQRFAENLNCTFDLACLRTKTLREISFNGNVGQAGKEATISDLLTWGPTIDDYNLFARPVDAFGDAAAVMDIPIIIGSNGDEVVLFQQIVDVVLRVASVLVGRGLSITMYEEEYIRLIEVIFKDKAGQVLAAYPPLPNNASNYENFVALGTLYLFECPTRQVRARERRGRDRETAKQGRGRAGRQGGSETGPWAGRQGDRAVGGEARRQGEDRAVGRETGPHREAGRQGDRAVGGAG